MIKKLYLQKEIDYKEITNSSHFPLTKKILYLLIALDLFFVMLHFYSLFLPLTEETKNLRLDKDQGYAELFQYLKLITIAGILGVLFLKKKLWILLVWSSFFLFLFVDDAFSYHEQIGREMIEIFNLSGGFGLRAQDIGELIFLSFSALLFVFFFLFSLVAGSGYTKKVTIHIFILMSIFIFFGVGMDMLHSILENMPGNGFITVLEDGGEMFSVSLIVWYTLYLWKKK